MWSSVCDFITLDPKEVIEIKEGKKEGKREENEKKRRKKEEKRRRKTVCQDLL